MSHTRNNPQSNIHPMLAKRWSPRAFDAGRRVENDKLLTCLEAARWAPSCFGDEPWRFIVCNKENDATGWEKLLACLSPKNQEWAKNAPVLMLACAATLFRSGKPNRWGQYDTGQAAISLCLQAEELGLATHQMGGFDADAVRDAFNIPADFTPMAAMALGYQGAAEMLDEGFRTTELAERKRQPIGSCFFAGSWDNPVA
jgi:nitroreductase